MKIQIFNKAFYFLGNMLRTQKSFGERNLFILEQVWRKEKFTFNYKTRFLLSISTHLALQICPNLDDHYIVSCILIDPN